MNGPPAEKDSVHFLPYGSYVAACGRIEDQRFPQRWSDLRRETTCGECQSQMTDLGDLPRVAPPGLGGDPRARPRVPVVQAMTDLTTFLSARLDGLEATARAATPGPWEWDDGGDLIATSVPGPTRVIITDSGFYPPDDETGDHIATHDPAYVLADVEAKRAILVMASEHAAMCAPDDWPTEGGMEKAALADVGRWYLRALAKPFAAHPDFDPAWLA